MNWKNKQMYQQTVEAERREEIGQLKFADEGGLWVCMIVALQCGATLTLSAFFKILTKGTP